MTTSNPSADLAAREADARRAVALAAEESDRLSDLAFRADEAARRAEIDALNAELAQVFGPLRNARDAAAAKLDAVLDNPKATLFALADAQNDADETQNTIVRERRAINARLDQLDPRIIKGTGAHVSRELPNAAENADAFTPFIVTLGSWVARHTRPNTMHADNVAARQARIVAAREAAVAEVASES